ncbi:hypothetical protein [Acetobacter malorum]|uniref:hypothetical protein n=1 Tax=Acetobacter malorum TaxID=178901 RepID=UPI0011777193|nr:hypothetical protein [Acetobacter malorum]
MRGGSCGLAWGQSISFRGACREPVADNFPGNLCVILAGFTRCVRVAGRYVLQACGLPAGERL